jgi:hypothetical protein
VECGRDPTTTTTTTTTKIEEGNLKSIDVDQQKANKNRFCWHGIKGISTSLGGRSREFGVWEEDIQVKIVMEGMNHLTN